MAKANSNASMVVSLIVLMLSFLLVVSFAESRSLGKKKPATLKCDSVYGVKDGDTCFDIATAFNLPTQFFESINPNINCKKLFVGQWVCLDGELSS